MQIKPFPALLANLARIPSPDRFCDQAKNKFLAYRETGLYTKSARPAFYVYQIESGGRTHTGLVAQNAISDFLEKRILPHEETLRRKEAQQGKLFLEWGAVLKPVLLAHAPVPEISAWLRSFAETHKPLISSYFKQDKETHRLWDVTTRHQQAELETLFAQHVPAAYIADGHHRTTTIARLSQEWPGREPAYDFSQLFVAFFAADQLDILDYNRVAQLPPEMALPDFLEKLGAIFDLEKLFCAARPTRKHEFTLFAQNDWFRLRTKPSAVPPRLAPGVDWLDASLLNELVFNQLLGIEDVRHDARLQYVDGTKGLAGLEKSVAEEPGRVGFCLHPVAFADMAALADAGQVLPPKSTWFEPRLRSGLVVQPLLG